MQLNFADMAISADAISTRYRAKSSASYSLDPQKWIKLQRFQFRRQASIRSTSGTGVHRGLRWNCSAHVRYQRTIFQLRESYWSQNHFRQRCCGKSALGFQTIWVNPIRKTKPRHHPQQQTLSQTELLQTRLLRRRPQQNLRSRRARHRMVRSQHPQKQSRSSKRNTSHLWLPWPSLPRWRFHIHNRHFHDQINITIRLANRRHRLPGPETVPDCSIAWLRRNLWADRIHHQSGGAELPLLERGEKKGLHYRHAPETQAGGENEGQYCGLFADWWRA